MIEQEKHCFTKLRKTFKYVLLKIVATFTQQHRSEAGLILSEKVYRF